jgi:arabinogalactan oligomer/maltooligosaccharide transport system substrate-binding protein
VEGKLIPAHEAVYRDPQLTGNAVLQGFRRQLDTAVPMPNLPGLSRTWAPLNRALEAVVDRRASPQDALDQAQRQVMAMRLGLKTPG